LFNPFLLVVQAAAESILLNLDRTSLAENGGHIKLTKTLGQSHRE